MIRSQAIAMAVAAVGSRKTTAHGYQNPYGAQCIALDAWYLEQLGYGSIMPGYNAIDVWTKNPLRLQAVSSPEPGDLFFANLLGPDGFNYGHTGIVVEVTSTGFYSIDQNWINANIDRNGGSAAARVFHKFSFAVGYLRPKYEGGEDMRKMSQDELIWNYRLIAGVDPSPGEIANFLKSDRDYATVNEDMKRYFANHGQGYNEYKIRVEKEIQALKNQLSEAQKQKPATTQGEAEAQLKIIKDAAGALFDALGIK